MLFTVARAHKSSECGLRLCARIVERVVGPRDRERRRMWRREDERYPRLGKLRDNENLVLVRKLICKHNVQSSNKSRNGSHTYPPTQIQPRASCHTFQIVRIPFPPPPGNGHLFRRLQRLLFVKSCFQTAGCVLSVRNPKLSCGICFSLLQKIRNSHCLLME